MAHGLIFFRQPEIETGPLARTALHADLSPMGFDDPFGDGQSQPRSRRWPGYGFFTPVNRSNTCGRSLAEMPSPLS